MATTLTLRTTIAGTIAAATLMAASAAAGPAVSRVPREITLPAGTVLPLTLDTTVGSDVSRIEDPVHAHLRRPVFVDGIEVLPAGSRVSGFVSDAQRSARVKGRARVAFRFTTLSSEHERYTVRTSRVVREAPGTKKRDAATIGIPAGAGAVIGALTHGKKGAAIGGAIGGGAGTGAVLATRGKEVRIGRGTPLGVRLLSPVTIALSRDR